MAWPATSSLKSHAMMDKAKVHVWCRSTKVLLMNRGFYLKSNLEGLGIDHYMRVDQMLEGFHGTCL